MVTEALLSSPVSSRRDRSSMEKQVQHTRSNLLETKLLIPEVACDCRSTVTVAGDNDLAVGLNEDRVRKGIATAECCAYKAAVTERRVYLPVRKIACQAKTGRAGNFVHVGERRLSNRDNVSICLGGDSKRLRKEI